MSKSYDVWRATETQDDGKRYHSPTDVYDAAGAAKKYAAHCHAERCGVEWSWPVEFYVRDDSTGKVTSYTVEREAVPEFWCGSGTPVEPGPHDPEFYPGHPDDKPCCPCGHPFGTKGPCAGCNCADEAP